MTKTNENLSVQSPDKQWMVAPCFMCTNQCGLRVCVENGKVTGIKGWAGHPRSQGGFCVKARHIPDYMYHEKRLRHPLKKANGRWERISWDEALDTIASKWLEAKDKYGPASCGVFIGEPACLTMELGWFQAWRLCDVFGTPSRFEALDLCGCSTWLGWLSTFGHLVEPDMAHSDCIILWATNPHATDPVAGVSQVNSALKKGAKLIVIDPRRTPFAKKADLHIRPQLGTDGFLALAMMHVIISQKLYDETFVNNYTVGFNRLAAHVKPYTPEAAERVCGVPAEEVIKAAQMFAESDSACIRTYFRLGWMPDGVQNHRSLSILSAITGNLDRPGGDLLFGFAKFAPTKTVQLPELMKSTRWVGSDTYPIYRKLLPVFKEGAMINFCDRILDTKDPVRNMIVVGSNPAVGWPNSSRVRQTLSKLDFLVSMDVVMTPTNEMADIILPATMAFERINFTTYHGEFIGRKLVEPYEEARSECRFWRELARKMGFEAYFPWKDDEETFNYFFEPATLK